MPRTSVPNVLAARYASADMAELWSPEHKVVLERRAVARGARGPARPRHRRARRRHRGLRGGGRPGRPRLDRRPRAGHPPRREGPHRRVLRPRRPRAHPQGHDLAGPHRERRAAPGPSARSCSSATGWSPRWPAWPSGPPSTPTAGDHRPQPQRRRRRPPRSASGSPTPARSCCRRLHRVDDLLARYPLRGIKGPVGTQQDQLDLLDGDAGRLDAARATRRRATSGFEARAHQRRPGVPALARPRRRVGAGAGGGRARPAWPPPSGSWPARSSSTEGFQARPGRLVGHAPQDEQPQLRAHLRLPRHPARAT